MYPNLEIHKALVADRQAVLRHDAVLGHRIRLPRLGAERVGWWERISRRRHRASAIRLAQSH